MMKCFFHKADFDGHCSGAIVKMVYPECEMIGINYGEPVDYSRISKEETVFMVDFSLQPAYEMLKMIDHCAELIWIDHHETAIAASEKYNFTALRGKREVGRAACELTWEYLCGPAPTPISVKLLGRYDVWDHEDPNVLPFQYGMRLHETHVKYNMPFWKDILDPSKELDTNSLVRTILKEGESIFKYETLQNKRICGSATYEIEFEGLKALVINRSHISSKFFDSKFDHDKYDLMIAWCRRPDCWTVSMYTSKPGINVANIATKFGGGGHAQAAGFQPKSIDFLLPKE